MLIDDFREINVQLHGCKIRDAVVFRIEEKVDDFWYAQIKDEEPYFSQPLPYKNLVIHFMNHFIWSGELKTKEGFYSIFSVFFDVDAPFALVNDDGTPRLVFLYFFRKTDLHYAGHSIYFPHLNEYKPTYNPEDSADRMLVLNYQTTRRFLKILSCKNIDIELVQPNVEIQKKRTSRGKLPLISFYILKIKNVGGTSESDRKGLWSNRVHFCRGHMKNYTAEAPLLGKHVGRYWFPPQVRGNPKKGFIMKDYEVST